MVWVVKIWLVTHTLEMVKGKEISSVDGRSGGGHGRSKDGSNATQRGTDEGSPVELKWLHQVVSKAEPQLLVVSVLARLLRKGQSNTAGAPGGSAGGGECQCQSVYKLGQMRGRQRCRVRHRKIRAVQAGRCLVLEGAIGQVLRHRTGTFR
jgi:hypothetical protein